MADEIIIQTEVINTEITINTVVEVPESSPGSTEKDFVLIQASRAALASDAGKVIMLDGSLAAVDYTIDPVTMALKEFQTICINNTNRVRSLPAGLATINGASEIEYNPYDKATIYADGANLFITAS